MPLGVYVVGGLLAVSLADTQVGPVVVAFLAAAVLYNAGHLLGALPQSTTTPAPNLGGGGGGHNLAV